MFSNIDERILVAIKPDNAKVSSFMAMCWCECSSDLDGLACVIVAALPTLADSVQTSVRFASSVRSGWSERGLAVSLFMIVVHVHSLGLSFFVLFLIKFI